MKTSGQMTLTVVSTPQLTPILDHIYVAGTFNNWNPSDEAFRLTHTDGVYSIEIPGNENETIEFKFTRGNWAMVEGNSDGTYMANRTLTMINGSIAELTISGWEDLAGTHTVTEHVRILDTDLLMPQLKRTRRIWIKLPEDYAFSDEQYPVLYMHDGQNLFDHATSFAGEWTVDEITDDLVPENCAKAIIVGIDNGGVHRIDEYAPWLNAEYNEGGEGSSYAEFIVETLKPLIESQFRARTEREYNFTGGSSLGALIATYMVLAHQDVFGGAINLSPAYWFNPEIQDMALNAGINPDMKMYFACGNDESDTMVGEIEQMMANLQSAGLPNLNLQSLIQTGGQHNEYWWAQYFSDAYQFTLGCTTGLKQHDQVVGMKIFPNPVKESFQIEFDHEGSFTLVIYDKLGKEMLREKVTAKQSIDISSLPRGVYTAEMIIPKGHKNQDTKHTQKLIKY